MQSSTKGAPGPSTPPVPGACAAAAGAANTSKATDGQPTNVPVHCESSGLGNSGSGVSTDGGSSGAGLESGG